jgi:putative PIN family toxin of toxin-antitoxin system
VAVKLSGVRVVIDTNVLVSSLLSRCGASFRLVQGLGSLQFQPIISPPLCLEYEDVLSRPGLLPDFSPQDMDDFLDYFLSQCVECRIHFLWRPHLPDPKDDSVLELALAGGASFIVTHNTRHFCNADSLGIRAVTPDQFLRILAAS